MLDWTDRHCRHFHRQLTRQTRLYTEMVTTGALRLVTRRAIWTTAPRSIPGPSTRGSEPEELAHATRLARQWGYDEVNLNCGCPSERVQRGPSAPA
jgi:tRNA-dihydrouridine synthase A